MININNDTETILKQLGDRLKEARLSRNESQELFAQRLGMTRQSYGKMEKGSPTTPIGNWLAASAILGRLGGWREVLAAQYPTGSLCLHIPGRPAAVQYDFPLTA